jgi:AcrR family transcriptional regulator
MPKVRTDEDILRMSLAAIWTLASTDGAASVPELARAAEVSVRTFHRYFPQKEDCIRPAIADARRHAISVFLDQPAAMSLTDAYAVAFDATANGRYGERTTHLVRAAAKSDVLRTVWVSELMGGARDFARAVERRSAGAVSAFDAETIAVIWCGVSLLALEDAAAVREGRAGGHGDPAVHLRLRLAGVARLAVVAEERGAGLEPVT